MESVSIAQANLTRNITRTVKWDLYFITRLRLADWKAVRSQLWERRNDRKRILPAAQSRQSQPDQATVVLIIGLYIKNFQRGCPFARFRLWRRGNDGDSALVLDGQSELFGRPEHYW